MIQFVKDWYSFGKSQGFLFALKYKLGIAKEGKDFVTVRSEHVDSN